MVVHCLIFLLVFVGVSSGHHIQGGNDKLGQIGLSFLEYLK